MTAIRRIPGLRPLACMGTQLVVARGLKLYLADADITTLRPLDSLPAGLRERLLGWLPIARRILRIGPTAAVAVNDTQALILNGSHIERLDIASGKLQREFTLPDGKRFLTLHRVAGIPGFADGFYGGEYWANEHTRAPVAIWFRPLHAPDWRMIHQFQAGSIDHIHTIVPDVHRGCLWILTGDFGDGAGIWQVHDQFQAVTPILRGEQRYRAAWLYPTANALFYATDSQLEPNHLYRASERAGGWAVDAIAPLEGSSIYSCNAADVVHFSTTVEPGMPTGRLADLFDRRPGPGIADRYAYLYRFSPQTGLQCLRRAEKDAWPMRLAQFGTFHFCQSASDKGVVYAYGAAIKKDNNCLLAITPAE